MSKKIRTPEEVREEIERCFYDSEFSKIESIMKIIIHDSKIYEKVIDSIKLSFETWYLYGSEILSIEE